MEFFAIHGFSCNFAGCNRNVSSFMKILITGASGFIGSFVVEEALRQGMETWAAIRPSRSKRYLTDPRIHFLQLDFSSEAKLTEALAPHCFDYIVHAAGLTKSLHQEDFYKVNTEGTINLVKALINLQMPIHKFVYLSSLSIFGAIREQAPYQEINEHDHPKPNTIYGKSKLLAEQFICSVGNNFPYVILRPTGVYGPRERDYFMMAQSVKNHIDFSAGFKQQDITFVYVKDVVQAIFLTFNHGMNGRKYFLTDGKVYSASDFSQLIRHALGNPWLLRVTVPLWVLHALTFVGEWIGHLTGKVSALNRDKYHILKQRNWRCNVEPAMDELGYHPHYPLERGVKETIEWYRQEKWL